MIVIGISDLRITHDCTVDNVGRGGTVDQQHEHVYPVCFVMLFWFFVEYPSFADPRGTYHHHSTLILSH